MNIMIGTPVKLSKEEFIVFLKKNNVEKNKINLIEECENDVVFADNNYKINVIVTEVDDNVNNIELNYYCPDTMEYLLPYKSINDIDFAINRFTNKLNDILS